MNDNLQSLHSTANDALVRILFERVSTMRSSPGHISQAAEISAGRPPVSSDAPEVADTGSDIASSEEPSLSMSMFASKADYDAALLAAVKAAG